jgi:hypothetical protein
LSVLNSVVGSLCVIGDRPFFHISLGKVFITSRGHIFKSIALNGNKFRPSLLWCQEKILVINSSFHRLRINYLFHLISNKIKVRSIFTIDIIYMIWIIYQRTMQNNHYSVRHALCLVGSLNIYLYYLYIAGKVELAYGYILNIILLGIIAK